MNDNPLVPRPGFTIEQEYTALSEEFLALEERYEQLTKPRVIIVDVRNGMVKATGENIDLPPEGQESALRSIETADVLVEIHPDTILVREGVDKGWVTMFTTKSEAQLSAEKAARDLQHRVGDKPIDDLEKGDHPSVKMGRVWDKGDPDYVESGEPEKRGLKGF